MADLVFDGKNSTADIVFGEPDAPTNQNPADLVFRQPIPTDADLVFGQQNGNTTEPNQIIISGTLTLFSLQIQGTVINDPNVSRGIKASSTAHYNKADDVKQSVRGTFLKAKSAKTTATELVQKAAAVKHQNKALFEQSPRIKSSTSEAFEKADRISNSAKTSWKKPGRIRTDTAAVYEKGIQRAITRSELFKYPPVARAKVSDAWSKAADLNVQIAEHYSAGRKLLIDRRAVWEKAGYPAPGSSVIPTPVDPEIPQLPPSLPVDLIFRERWNPLAYRSLVFGVKAAPINPFSEVYIIMPSAILYRLPDGTEIEATDVNWSSDLDSWGWRFSATLKYESDMALLKPDNNGMKHIGCTINEHEFIGIVERYSRARSFESGTTFRIEGRSRSAEFSDPFSAKGSGVVAQDLNARQIVESLLQNSGWTLDWQVPDWLVPANSLNWSDADKMSVINQVAQSIGAVVQTHPSHKTLLIKSRYPVSPWHWDDTETMIKTTLPAALIKSDSADFIQRPKYNGAIVAGGPTSGVIIKAKRDGTAGEILPSTVVNPLISDTISGRERARVEISKGGWWESLNAVTWLTNPGEGPALLSPGDLIEIIDIDSNYRAQIGGVSVAVRSTEDALNITQSIQAEKQYGN